MAMDVKFLAMRYRICLDAAGRRLELLVSDEEMARRKSAVQLPKMLPNRGYGKLFHDHVVQAPGGVYFDFLQDLDRADASGDAELCLWYVLNLKFCRGI